MIGEYIEMNIKSRDDLDIHSITKLMPSKLNNKIGLIIVEGVDGVGKTTFIKKLKKELFGLYNYLNKHVSIQTIHFPTGKYVFTSEHEHSSNDIVGEPINNTAPTYISDPVMFQYICLNEILEHSQLLEYNLRFPVEGEYPIIYIIDRYLWSNLTYSKVPKDISDYPSKEAHDEKVERINDILSKIPHFNILITMKNIDKLKQSVLGKEDFNELDKIHLSNLLQQQDYFISLMKEDQKRQHADDEYRQNININIL